MWSSFVNDNKNDFLIFVEVCGNVSLTLQNNERANRGIVRCKREQGVEKRDFSKARCRKEPNHNEPDEVDAYTSVSRLEISAGSSEW